MYVDRSTTGIESIPVVPYVSLIAKEKCEIAANLINNLKDSEKDIIVRWYLMGESLESIAKDYNITGEGISDRITRIILVKLKRQADNVMKGHKHKW